MINNLSKEDIINSVEYQWRKHQIKLYFYIWILTSVLTLFVPFIVSLKDLSILGFAMIPWLGIITLCGIIFGCAILYSFNKERYLKNNYKKFTACEVKLDKVSTSYMYRGAVYYSVVVDSRKVDTNPIFSSSIYSKFLLEEYNNKTVIGLFDEELNKFYIIKKVN